MPRAVRIRGVDDDVYAGLARRAGEEGITVPELLRPDRNPQLKCAGGKMC